LNDAVPTLLLLLLLNVAGSGCSASFTASANWLLLKPSNR
jgi:hypothetical protein